MHHQKYFNNKFDTAIAKGELKAFAYGLNDYHVPDRDYSDHEVGSNWTAIMASQEREMDTTKHVTEMFSMLLEETKAEAEYDILYRHFWYYHYFSNEKTLHFQLPEKLIASIKERLKEYLTLLKNKSDQEDYFTKNIIKGLKIVLEIK
jgi:hypothetical protein